MRRLMFVLAKMYLPRIAFTVRKLTRLTASDRRFGLCSIDEFKRVLARERARTDRSGEGFSLLAFLPVDSRTAEATQRRLAKILRHRLRCTDEAGWLDRRRIGVLLPATASSGAWTVAADVCDRLPAGIPRPQCAVFSYPSTPTADADRSRHAAAQNGQGDRRGRRRQPGQVATREETGVCTETLQSIPVCDPGSDGADAPEQSLEPLFARGLPWWKRGLDIAGATVGLTLLSPVLVAVGAAVRLTSPGPVFFRQYRSGLGGKPFVMYKFRSMTHDAETKKKELLALSEQDGPAFKIKHDPRVTRLGRLLRATSIDELPQLWNVLRGDMSLVGPRPLPCDESDRCQGWRRRRLDVTPGLTCIWQTSGRSKVTFDEWARMDMRYIRSRSLYVDVKLLAKTIPSLVLRRGM